MEDDGRVRWAERGTLTWAAGSTPVSRTLFLVRAPAGADAARAAGAAEDPGTWRVTFEDGRDFHPWTGGAVEHLCGRDLYEGGVGLPEEPVPSSNLSWELRWRVTGPEKDYTMHTTYSRPCEAQASAK